MYRVLLPIDRNEDRALSQAAAVGALPGGDETIDVTILHVFEDQETAESTSVKQLAIGKRVSEHLTDALPHARIEPESRWGDVAETVLEVADEQDVDVIVLGGRKRSPMGSLLFGSVSRDVLQHTTRPVMITGGESAATDDRT